VRRFEASKLLRESKEGTMTRAQRRALKLLSMPNTKGIAVGLLTMECMIVSDGGREGPVFAARTIALLRDFGYIDYGLVDWDAKQYPGWEINAAGRAALAPAHMAHKLLQ
jgi:hypothetical protein